MPVVAHLEPLQPEPGERRGAPRLLLTLGTGLGPMGSRALICDLSLTGLLIETSAELSVGQTIEVELPEVAGVLANVMWRGGSFFGCEFETPIPAAALSAALLRSAHRSLPAQAVESATLLRLSALAPAEQGHMPRRPENADRHRVVPALILALALSGLAYLLLTSHLVAAAVLALFVALAASLVAWGSWVMNNTIHIKF